MDEKQAKVHNVHKSKHRRGTTSRGHFTESTSPSKASAPPTTTTPIVIVQSQSNDDEMAESPASSIHVNSKNVQSSGFADTGIQNAPFYSAFVVILIIYSKNCNYINFLLFRKMLIFVIERHFSVNSYELNSRCYYYQ